MSEFYVYCQLGLTHILDWQGYDHILFVISICLSYHKPNWKRIAWVLTAFTLGHSISLAAATLRLFSYSQNLIEILIPITIILTALFNVFANSDGGNIAREFSGNRARPYLSASCFGLIHGLGFSGYLQSLLGKEGEIFKPLLAFNLGLEMGQLIIVTLFAFTIIMLNRTKHYHFPQFRFGFSAFIAGVAFCLLLQRV